MKKIILAILMTFLLIISIILLCVSQFVNFLLNNGEEKLYLLPENIFDQLKEGIKGNLYIKNNAYFDFEEIE